MADKKTYTGLSKNYATVPAFSITTIEYLDTKPNYFRVQNRGTTEIYCSTNNMPTTKHYDFAVPGKKMKMFAEPYNRTRLYIFNPSGADVEVAVLSFQAEFDPLTLALSEIEVEMPSSFESSMVINSFNASLPVGNNKIGKVEVTNGPAAADITSIKNDVGENLLKFDTLMGPARVAGKTNLYDIMLALQALAASNYVQSVLTFDEKEKSTDTYLYQGSPSKYCDVHLLTNDGAGDLTIKIQGEYDLSVKTLTLKPGESITDLKFKSSLLAVSGTNYSFRAMITLRGE